MLLAALFVPVGAASSSHTAAPIPSAARSSEVARSTPSRTGKSLFPRFADAVPVLLYHRILPRVGGRGVTLESFDGQLRRLHDLGFEAITLDQYVRFVRGDVVDLPPRPFLITFDDGYRSALQMADPVLARYGWSAVLFIPTGAVGLPGRLTWDELRGMRASGRWAIAEHAGDGHVLVTVDSSGRRAPFYANEEWADGELESFAQYQQRVRDDIELGSRLLARNLPGWEPDLSFAVPYGNYGQRDSNEPRAEPWLTAYLESRFVVTFVQHGDEFTTPGHGFANRLTVTSDWNGVVLERHLRAGLDRLASDRTRRRTAAPSTRSTAPLRVTFVGDSVPASIDYAAPAKAELTRGLSVRLDLKVCRRLVEPSCTYRGVTPTTALQAVQSYGQALGQTLIVNVGYNDAARGYDAGIDRVMRAALAGGARGVVWVNLRESRSGYRRTNAAIRSAVRRWPQLVVADWNAYSAGKPWFGRDGLHLNATGATALATFLRPYVYRAAGTPGS